MLIVPLLLDPALYSIQHPLVPFPLLVCITHTLVFIGHMSVPVPVTDARHFSSSSWAFKDPLLIIYDEPGPVVRHWGGNGKQNRHVSSPHKFCFEASALQSKYHSPHFINEAQNGWEGSQRHTPKKWQGQDSNLFPCQHCPSCLLGEVGGRGRTCKLTREIQRPYCFTCVS